MDPIAKEGENTHSCNGYNSITIKEDKSPLHENINDGSFLDDNNSARLFYGVFVPTTDSQTGPKETQVFTDRTEALRFLKQNKQARFKAFSNKVDALYFTQHGISTNIKTTSPFQSIAAQKERSMFKAPISQELVKFRKAIEVSDMSLIKKFVEENPRYLISSGDTPSILQEGPRYNALHVAARHNAAEVVSYILELITTSELTNRIYGTQEAGIETDLRASVLLDLFLNTPDKSLNETPLHFASKIGSISVVKILILYPECDRNRRNKFDLSPLDVVCTRATGTFRDNEDAIKTLLKESYYIPVLRSHDNTIQPLVGDPINLSYRLDSSMKNRETALSPRVQIQALAGPMAENKAKLFCKKWRSPRSPCIKDIKQNVSPSLRPSLYDIDKGLERIGRSLASEFKVQWTEYWPFLDTFVDLVSTEGLNMLETFLKDKFQSVNSVYSNVNCFETNNSENCSRGNQELTPIGDLCIQFSRLHIKEENSFSVVAPLCVPIMCFEKFLTIFAKRLATTVSRCRKTDHEISQLEAFLTSCSRDKRFDNINLNKAHYRLSQILELSLRSLMDKAELISLLSTMLKCKLSLNDCNEDLEIVRTASVCIISFVLDHLSSECTNSDSNAVNKSWLNSKSCQCKPLRDKKIYREKIICKRKLNFQEIDNSNTAFLTTIQEDLGISSIQQEIRDLSTNIDNCSDSGDEFATPPSSPSRKHSQDGGDFEDLPMCVSDIFLAGEKPSKLDSAVLCAIVDVDITSEKYPFIYYWKQQCENIALVEDKTRWSSPNVKLDYNPDHRKLLKDLLSPSWHN